MPDLHGKTALDSGVRSVGAYLRLSREDEVKNRGSSQSIENQKEYITRYVLEKGWDLVDVYSDDGYSGTNFDRPGFKRLLEDIGKRRINTVITKDLSRLGRDYIETGYYMEKFFPIKGIRYIALSDGIDTFEDTSNDMGPFKSVLNDLYAKDISKKVKAAVHIKRLNGKFIGAFAPYGYRKCEKDRNRLVIDYNTAPIVKRIFDMYLEGFSLIHIANNLTVDKVPTPAQYTGRRNANPLGLWKPETIKVILTNPTYTGSVTQNKCMKLSYKMKTVRPVPKSQWVVVENTHAAIVDKETFCRVQQLLERNIRYRNESKKEHLLSGLLFCGDCGEKMSFVSSHGRYYAICGRYRKFSRLRLCTRHTVPEDELENRVISELEAQVAEHLDPMSIKRLYPKGTEKGTAEGANLAGRFKSMGKEGKIVLSSLVDRIEVYEDSSLRIRFSSKSPAGENANDY